MNSIINQFLSHSKPDSCRHAKLEKLEQYYLHFICEDQRDGTAFDDDFLNFIEDMKKKYNKN